MDGVCMEGVCIVAGVVIEGVAMLKPDIVFSKKKKK